MSRNLLTTTPDELLTEAAQRMGHHRIRRLPVVEGDHLVGILSKSDLYRAAPSGLDPFSAEAVSDPTFARPVGEIMTRHPITTHPEAPLERAARTLIEKKIGALPVVRDGVLEGIITESDMFRAITDALGAEIPGVRITFDASKEDSLPFAVDLATKNKMRVVSVVTHYRQGRRMLTVRLAGDEPARLIETIWKSGRSVLSVIRYPYAGP